MDAVTGPIKEYPSVLKGVGDSAGTSHVDILGHRGTEARSECLVVRQRAIRRVAMVV